MLKPFNHHYIEFLHGLSLPPVAMFLPLGLLLPDNLILFFVVDLGLLYWGSCRLQSDLFRLVLSRILAWWFWGQFSLFLPITLCWLASEPLFIPSGLSYGKRLEYFISRWPFMLGRGLLPSLFWIWGHPTLAVLTVILTAEGGDKPKLYRFLPYSPVTFPGDPIEMIEKLI